VKKIGLPVIFAASFFFWGCAKSANHFESNISFTRADSLTERYLFYQDSLLMIWNTIVHHENTKIATMRNLMHELMISNRYQSDELANLDTQLNLVTDIKLTQESLGDTTLMKEYHATFDSLMVHMVNMTESNSAFGNNNNLQKMTDAIKKMDQRTLDDRKTYNLLVKELNIFIDQNETDLLEKDQQLLVKKMAQFPVGSSE
jgi:hypothetical protein